MWLSVAVSCHGVVKRGCELPWWGKAWLCNHQDLSFILQDSCRVEDTLAVMPAAREMIGDRHGGISRRETASQPGTHMVKKRPQLKVKVKSQRCLLTTVNAPWSLCTYACSQKCEHTLKDSYVHACVRNPI